MGKLIWLAVAACWLAHAGAPRFRAQDVRPHGAAEPYPLTPGLPSWIFGANLGDAPGCTAANFMDPATYKTELCGTRVLVGGIAARLIFVSPGQINLVLPDRPWENRLVDVQVLHRGEASALVPVRFGSGRPVLSPAAPARAGMPVWVRVRMPWRKGRLRYPAHTEPWDLGPGLFEVRFHGRTLAPLPQIPYFASGSEWMIGLPREVPPEYLHRAPLHLVYPFDRPGTYQIRYAGSAWTAIQVLPSTAEERRVWFQRLAGSQPDDTVELLSDFLPSLLAARHEPALRLLARYLDSPDPLVRQYAAYALNYFDAGLLARVVPGRTPLRGGVR